MTGAKRCRNKIGYATRAEANADLREAKRHAKASGDTRAYRCSRCGEWHLGRRVSLRLVEKSNADAAASRGSM